MAKDWVTKFETAFAARYDLGSGVACSRARIAFYYLLKHLPLEPGGEVLISAIHVADFVNVIRLAGFVPKVVDLMPNSLEMDYDDLEAKLTSRSQLFVVTHLSGYGHDMARLCQISAQRGVPFVEDCSQSINSRFQGQRLGTFGVASFFSLSLIKEVCTLMGGMVLSKDQALIKRIRQDQSSLPEQPLGPLKAEATKNLILHLAVSPALFLLATFPTLRLTRSLGDLFASYQKTNKTVVLRDQLPPGMMVRFGWRQAKMGLEQLETVEQRTEQRKKRGYALYQRLLPLTSIRLPREAPGTERSAWLFPVFCDRPERLAQHLAARGIDTAPMLLSHMPSEPAFAALGLEAPRAKEMRGQILFLPMYSDLTQAELERIAQAVETF